MSPSMQGKIVNSVDLYCFILLAIESNFKLHKIMRSFVLQIRKTKSEATSMTDIEVDLEKVDGGANEKVKPVKSKIYLQLISSIVGKYRLLQHIGRVEKFCQF